MLKVLLINHSMKWHSVIRGREIELPMIQIISKSMSRDYIVGKWMAKSGNPGLAFLLKI